MNAYHCTSCAINFTPTDEAWEQVIAAECCPKCNIKLAKRIVHPLLSDEHSKQWFAIFYKSKHLVIMAALLVIAAAYPGLWVAYSLPQGYSLSKVIVLVVWTPAYCLLMLYLNKVNVMRSAVSIPLTLLMLFLVFNIGKHDPHVTPLSTPVALRAD